MPVGSTGFNGEEAIGILKSGNKTNNSNSADTKDILLTESCIITELQ